MAELQMNKTCSSLDFFTRGTDIPKSRHIERNLPRTER